MSYSVLSWIKQYMLPCTRINSEPYTDPPVESGLPYPNLLGAAFISCDFPEMYQLQFASGPSRALQPRLTVSSNDSRRSDHVCVPHKPCYDRMANRDVGLDVALKTNL